jgi:drug/metabolite transporter (DMT)-like permease
LHNELTFDKRNAKGICMALLAAACSSIAPIFIKVGLIADVGLVTLLLLRLLVAAIVFWTIFPVLWPDALRIDRKGLLGCVAVAAANTGSLLCFYAAFEWISATVALVVFSAYPLMTMVQLALRGERTGWQTLLRLALGLAGIYVLLGFDRQVNMLGVVLVLGAVTGYALHTNLIQWHLKQYPSETVALYTITLMTLFTAIVRVLQPYAFHPVSSVGWLAILVTGIVSTAFARLALFGAIHRIGSGQVALFGPVEILLGVLWTTLFLRERMTPVQWAGALMIVLSAALVSLHREEC